MSVADTEAEDMAKKAAKTAPVRLTEEAMRWARIASGYTGESLTEYASRILTREGKKDADRLHAEAQKRETAEKQAKGPKKEGV